MHVTHAGSRFMHAWHAPHELSRPRDGDEVRGAGGRRLHAELAAVIRVDVEGAEDARLEDGEAARGDALGVPAARPEPARDERVVRDGEPLRDDRRAELALEERAL